jgi:inner membrane protein
MASVAHLAAGAFLGAVYARRTSSSAAVAVPVFAALALAPDIDFVAVHFGSDGTPLEHRAMTHAIPFAVVAGMTLGTTLARPPHRLFAGVVAFLALASHGLLDAMTANAPGPRLWWPFSAAHVSLAWRPIPGTQYWQQYFSPSAVPVFAAESLVSLPFLLAAALVLWGPSLRRGRATEIGSRPWNRLAVPSSD